MKVTIEAGALAREVAWAAKALPGRPAVPVLAGMRLTATTDGLELAVFDYETSAATAAPAEVGEPGTVLVPGRLLHEITKRLDRDAVVELDADAARLRLATAGGAYELLTLPLEDYPALPEPGEVLGTVGAGALAGAVARAQTATSTDRTLPVLTAVYLDPAPGGLHLAATDRYRLTLEDLDWIQAPPPEPAGAAEDDLEEEEDADDGDEQEEEKEPDLLVEARTLAWAAKTVSTSASAEVALRVAEDGGVAALVGLSCGARTVTMRLLGADWLSSAAAMAEGPWEGRVEVEAGALAGAVARVAVLLERNIPIRLQADAEAGAVRVSGGAGTAASGSENVPAQTTGDVADLAFNADFLADALKSAGALAPRVGLQTRGATKATLLTPAPESDDGAAAYRCVLMPVRLSG